MDWLNKNYEKVIVAVVALICLGLGATRILKVLNYADGFQLSSPTPKNELPDLPLQMVKACQVILSVDFNWNLKEVAVGENKNKTLPLLNSVPIISYNDDTFNLGNPDEKNIRPPIDNVWLLEHKLDYLRHDVLQADPDSDGYSNLEEWEAKPKTVPVDPNSHPPYTDKLLFVERKQRSFFLTYAAKNPPLYQVNTRGSSGRKSQFVKVGETFLAGRFTVVGHEDLEGANDSGINTDISQLEIKDNSTGKTFKLVRRREENWPDYFAHFNFTLDPTQNKFFVKEGETFQLSLEPSQSYRLLEVQEDRAILDAGDGKKVTIMKGAIDVPDEGPSVEFMDPASRF